MTPPLDFYELQKRQKIRSFAAIGLLLFFYVAAVGLFMLAGWMTFGLFSARAGLFGPGFWLKFAVADLLFAGGIAAIHYFDARKNGAAFLLKRLSAKPPDRSDRYHLLFAEAVEAVRLAAGLPRVEALILPTFSLNSLALIQPEGTPAVVVTEGLLAECSRDEVEAVVAHEIAHIARGDTTLLTLVCGLSAFFERLRDTMEPDFDSPDDYRLQRGNISGSTGLLYVAAALGTIVIRLLGVFVTRERELLADAAAVEFGRSPEALARVIFKAQARNAFIGDFSQAYAPLFLIAPSSGAESRDSAPRWTSSHPSFTRRIELLAAMAHKTPREIGDLVRAAQKNRRSAQTIASVSDRSTVPPQIDPNETVDGQEWVFVHPDRGEIGPFSLSDLLIGKGFSPSSRIKNLAEGLEGRAEDFPQIREALRHQRQGRPVEMKTLDRCPRCKTTLGNAFYEGISIKICRRCGGKLIDRNDMNRVIARREIGFSEALVRKAEAFREKYLLNPAVKAKSDPPPESRLQCPSCGFRMMPRPFNYQYFVPVDKCLSCNQIWFDADELEILQVLIEQAKGDL